MKATTVLTIGHSTHPAEKFLELLRLQGVDAVADVRSSPYSRFNPQFNRDELRTALKTAGIAYVFLGRELGARSDNPACYDTAGQVQYRKLAQTESFQQGLDRVIEGSKKHRLALLCAEKEPLECHRTILIARELVARGVKIQHIQPDGSLESHDDAMDRLLKLHGLPQQDLFRGRDDLLEEAYERQERRIAYTRGDTATETE